LDGYQWHYYILLRKEMSMEDEIQKEKTIRGLASEYVALNSKIHPNFDLE
jgi:hypothetical protein